VPWCADPRRAIIGADIYVTASRTETYAIATLEALGCGRAIIARRVGNTPAYVTDGVNRLLFDKDEQLPELLSRSHDQLMVRGSVGRAIPDTAGDCRAAASRMSVINSGAGLLRRRA
jgi:glycosyltransferase involved in cell wall biosynthesis